MKRSRPRRRIGRRHRAADPLLFPGLAAEDYEAEAERSIAALFDPTVKARRRRPIGDLLVLVALAEHASEPCKP